MSEQLDRWIKAPVDMDDVPIKLGDLVTDGNVTGEVTAIELRKDSVWIMFSSVGMRPGKLRHAGPSVQSELRQFFKDAYRDVASYASATKIDEALSSVIERYADKFELSEVQ